MTHRAVAGTLLLVAVAAPARGGTLVEDLRLQAEPPATESQGHPVVFVALGIVGTGAVTLAAMVLMARLEAPAPVLLVVPPVAAAGHFVLGDALDVPVSWGSALVGAGLGAATGFAVGTGGALLQRSSSTGGEGFADIAAFIAGVLIGTAVATPLWTWLDPFSLAD